MLEAIGEARTRAAGKKGLVPPRMRVIAALVAATMTALWASDPALAAYTTDSGGPNGPCGNNSSVNLVLKYKGDAILSYENRNGTYFGEPLPYHSSSYGHFENTHQDGLKWWRVKVVTDNGYVSRDGSYGYCGSP